MSEELSFCLRIGQRVEYIPTLADVHTWVGVNGGALEQDSGSPVGKRPVDTVAVSGYPTNICHAAEYISVMVVEDILVTRGKRDGTNGKDRKRTNGILFPFIRPKWKESLSVFY